MEKWLLQFIKSFIYNLRIRRRVIRRLRNPFLRKKFYRISKIAMRIIYRRNIYKVKIKAIRRDMAISTMGVCFKKSSSGPTAVMIPDAKQQGRRFVTLINSNMVMRLFGSTKHSYKYVEFNAKGELKEDPWAKTHFLEFYTQEERFEHLK